MITTIGFPDFTYYDHLSVRRSLIMSYSIIVSYRMLDDRIRSNHRCTLPN